MSNEERLIADLVAGFTRPEPTVLERGMRETYFPHPAYELANAFEQHTATLTRDDRYYAATQMQLDDWRLLARKFGLTLRREGDVRYALVILANRTDEWEFWETVRREGQRLGLHNDGFEGGVAQQRARGIAPGDVGLESHPHPEHNDGRETP